MKKQSFLCIAPVALMAFSLFGCGEKNYTVTFNCNGGSEIRAVSVKENEKVSKPTDPTKANYTFGGWYTDEKCSNAYNFDLPVKANFTLYAKWTINSFTVTFNSNGGSEIASQKVNYGEKVSKPTDPTKENYSFINWYSDKELTTPFLFDSTEVQSNLTLYARWAKSASTVSDLENAIKNGEDVALNNNISVNIDNVDTIFNITKSISIFGKDKKNKC